MCILRGKDLALGYNGKIVADNIYFQIKKGTYTCIVGENGVGKSTLIKTMIGLINPIKGDISYGEELQKNDIGYLPQQTEIQRDFPASVKEIVMSGFQGQMGLRPFYTKKEIKIANINMKKMRIDTLSKNNYRELSGGQQQRVLLARALCASQKLLVLDEPVAGLDPNAIKDFYKLISNLNKEGITIIMISHDIESAINNADYIIHVAKETFFGTKHEYLKSDLGKKFLMLQELESNK